MSGTSLPQVVANKLHRTEVSLDGAVSDGSDEDGGNPSQYAKTSLGRQVAQATRFAGKAWNQKRCFKAFGILFPWLLAMLIGVLTALTGTYITLNCDFLSDFRFGFCRGLLFADRNRCCGGSDNLDVLGDRCVMPVFGASGKSVEWVTWEEFIGVESRVDSWAGYLLAFLCYMLPSAAFSGLAVFLVSEYCPAARGSGIPEVKAAVSGFDLPNHLSGWCLLVKTIGLSLVVGAGLSLGKEGPLIQIGACWACLLKHHMVKPLDVLGLPGEPLPLHALACVGAAAGVSTAFGAPLGGVLFAAEELGSMRELSRRTLLLAFLAAFTASFVQKHMNLSGANRLTLFNLSVPTHDGKKEWVSWELPAFLLIGIIAGLVGAFFIRLNLRIAKERRKSVARGRLWFLPNCFQKCCLGWWVGRDDDAPKASRCSINVVEGVLIAIVTALLNYPFTALLRNNSTEAIYALFETCPHKRSHYFGLCDEAEEGRPNIRDSMSASLLLAATIRVFQTSFTFGSCMPSGLFIPSLIIGATTGRFVGNVMLMLNEYYLTTHKTHIDPGNFAMVGAVASLSGFCRMTVSLVVIMLELTGELTYVVPFMSAALVAKLVGDSLSLSVYDAHAYFNGYPPVEELEDIRLDILLADLAKELEVNSVIDVNEPVPLQTLLDAIRNTEALVVMHTDEPESGTKPADRIIGVVECTRLQRWMKHLPQETADADDFCSFSPQSDVEDDWNSIPLSDDSKRKRTLDASELVDGNIARLSAHAPLLTAQCVFEQKPSLGYCVCVDESTKQATFSLLSRQAMLDAITDGPFPLQRRAVMGAHSPSHGQVGATAAAEVCRDIWRSSSSRLRDRLAGRAHNKWRRADRRSDTADLTGAKILGAATVDERDDEDSDRDVKASAGAEVEPEPSTPETKGFENHC